MLFADPCEYPVLVSRRFIPLFWRLFVPNASVLLAASIVLMIEPANGRVVALVGGLTLMLVINLVLMRRAFAPLVRLTQLVEAVDPLRPGQRLPSPGPESEVSVLTGAVNGMLDRLETERRESARRELLAQEMERRHIAAELHDEIGQTLTAITLHLDLVARELPEGPRAEVEAASGGARDALEEVRSLARRLRPDTLDELGLVPALRSLCDRLSAQTGVAIGRSLPEELTPLSTDAELVVYRVAQESLTNAVRHAAARRIELELRRADGAIELAVADDGVGFGVDGLQPEGSGIRGMRERALLVGGRVELGRSRAGGALVTLRIPVRPS